MQCQACDQNATQHITDIVAGKAVEYHVCDEHAKTLDLLPPTPLPKKGYLGFFTDPALCDVLREPKPREVLAAHLLPALCLALLDPMPEVRIAAAFHLMRLGPDGRSAAGALRDALRDRDERVVKAASIALDFLESDEATPWFI
jgi:hypothetical protein